MTYLSNAFSLSMLDSKNSLTKTVEVTAEKVAASNFTSVVGHPDTANILSGILGVPVAYNRMSIKLKQEDILYVAQYNGARLPEGATVLPDGATMDFLRVTTFPHKAGGCRGYNCEMCAITRFSCTAD